MKYIPVKIPAHHRRNFVLTERYLRYYRPKPGRPDFSMKQFAMNEYGNILKGAGRTDCGTAGCVAGHSVHAGVRKTRSEDWWIFLARCFGADCAPDSPQDAEAIYNWVFSSCWTKTDNTACGAAARIRILLKYGVPENHYLQMEGLAPLCYGKKERT